MTEVALIKDLVSELRKIYAYHDDEYRKGIEFVIEFLDTKWVPRMPVYKYCPECGEQLYGFDDIVLMKMPHEYLNGCGECRGCLKDGGGYCELWSQIEDLTRGAVECSRRGNKWREKYERPSGEEKE